MAGTPNELVVALRTASQELTARRSIRDLDVVLGQIVQSAVDTVPGADAAGLSITENSHVASRNPTGPVVGKLDQLQSDLGEGPCITAIAEPATDGVVYAEDLAGDDAQLWPRFAPHAVENGFRSILSMQLNTHGGMRAALNLYAAEPRVFTGDARNTAALFAMQAAVLLYGSEHARDMQRAIDSRDIIGQAKGILMERFHTDADGSFEMLVSSSQNANMKLVDVARWLIEETGQRAPHAGADTEDG